jgi:heme oxygenase
MAEKIVKKIDIIHTKILVNRNYHSYVADLSGGKAVRVRSMLARKCNWGGWT